MSHDYPIEIPLHDSLDRFFGCFVIANYEPYHSMRAETGAIRHQIESTRPELIVDSLAKRDVG